MRRAAALVTTALLAVPALAACGSSSSSSSAAPTANYKQVKVTGDFDKSPTVTIPKETGSGTLYIKTLIQGTGSTFSSSTTEAVIANYVAYDWSGKTSKELGSSFTVGTPSIFTGNLLTGLEKALVGQKTGSRVIAVVPPSDAFGTAGNTSDGIGKSDTLVFVVDLISTFATSLSAKQTSNGGGSLPTVTPATVANTAPTIKIPAKVTAPKTLQTKVLIKGTGAKTKAGQYIAVQYTGVNWRTGSVFDSSYTDGGATTFQLTTSSTTGNGLIPGMVTGLVGQTVGSRVLIAIPPVDGYGSSGVSAAGIEATDDLVFVVDILSVVSN
jgi:FKBP-type peptidyl-prolyl cis-trans isomerase